MWLSLLYFFKIARCYSILALEWFAILGSLSFGIHLLWTLMLGLQMQELQLTFVRCTCCLDVFVSFRRSSPHPWPSSHSVPTLVGILGNPGTLKWHFAMKSWQTIHSFDWFRLNGWDLQEAKGLKLNVLKEIGWVWCRLKCLLRFSMTIHCAATPTTSGMTVQEAWYWNI